MPENDRGGYTGLSDMFDGGGPGRSGAQFEGGGMISSIGNAMGGPSAFGFGGGDGGGGGFGGNRGAQIGRTVGGMMFGPLGMIGGGILGNMIGGGMSRGSAMAPAASDMPAQRPSPAMVAARSPASSIVPTQRPFAPTDAAVPTMPSVPSIMNMPGAVERFIAEYGNPNLNVNSYAPPPLPGVVMMDPAFSMPSPDVNMPRVSPTGYMPPVGMVSDPMMDPRNMVSLPIDFRTGRPMAMQPPRVQ